MLKFLASNVEQLDLALEHISQGDANNARFALMLVDNVVEITLHQIAQDEQREAKSWIYRDKPYKHSKELNAALGQHFKPKVTLAKKIGKLGDEASGTIALCHSFRNEVYHIGLQHEAVLPAISRLHFKIACEFLGSYKPLVFSYSPGMTLPVRARKYFKDQNHFMNGIKEYLAACVSLANSVSIDPKEFTGALADHLDEVIEQQDMAVHMIATGGPHQTSRDEAVSESMAWKIAFTDEGKAFARDQGWSQGSVFDFIKWIERNYPFSVKKDPIPSWKKRARGVRIERNPHRALKKYRDFMTQTNDTRIMLEEAHGQVEQYIDEQIDRMRGG